jgi:diacylglycerol kinase family enzyme
VRALLVVNPMATSTSPRVRDVLARALASDLKLDVVETTHRGHAIELAREAATSELDLVVTLGGDGVVNEAVNGLAGSATALAVVPGGSTNVFARALGLSNSPVEATSEILDALRAGRRRVINLGQAGDRYFAFCLGLGLDAEVVLQVERRRSAGRRATPALYIRSAVQHFFTGTERSEPALTLTLPGEPALSGLHNLVVANGAPWTYLGGRPVNPCPQAAFDADLDLVAMRSLRTVSTLRVVRQILRSQPRLPRRLVHARHDVECLTATSTRPLAWQVDGDYLGETEALEVRSRRGALTIVV